MLNVTTCCKSHFGPFIQLVMTFYINTLDVTTCCKNSLPTEITNSDDFYLMSSLGVRFIASKMLNFLKISQKNFVM